MEKAVPSPISHITEQFGLKVLIFSEFSLPHLIQHKTFIKQFLPIFFCNTFFILFLLEYYGRLTMLYQLLLYSKGPSHTDIYILFLIVSSIMFYPETGYSSQCCTVGPHCSSILNGIVFEKSFPLKDNKESLVYTIHVFPRSPSFQVPLNLLIRTLRHQVTLARVTQ